MHWGGITTVFMLATVKFMVAPLSGLAFNMTFWETYFAAVAGGCFSAAVFYFPSDYFMLRAQRKYEEARNIAKIKGKPFKEKKKFTRINRVVVTMKSKLGIYGIAMWAPFFMSVPIGSIVTAKFFGTDKRTYPIICLGMVVNALITTGLTYLF